MAYPDNDRAEQERQRWTRENAHLHVRHDANRFMRPDAPGWKHPDAKLFDRHFRYREKQPTETRAAPAFPERRALDLASPTLADASGPSLGGLLKLKSEGAALRVQLARITREIVARRVQGLPPLRESDPRWLWLIAGYQQYRNACLKAGFDPNQPRVPAGNPDGGQWASEGGAGGGDASAGGAVLGASIGGSPGDSGSDPPKVPKERPESARVRNRVVKEVAKWLVKVGARQLTGPVGSALNIAEGVSWLYEAYPYVRAYTDAPKTLPELQESVGLPQAGYDVHHIVEQTAAEQDGYPRSLIDGPENLVRVPTLKHWEITGWYMTPNDDYGGQSPRAYLRGKSWQERRRVGIGALVQHKVLRP